MVASREPQHMTVDEWRELERNSHDIKYEYIDGHVYAMSGGSLARGRIANNTIRTLEDALAAGGTGGVGTHRQVAWRLVDLCLRPGLSRLERCQ